MSDSSEPVGGAPIQETAEASLWHSGRLGRLVARAEAPLRRQLREWRRSTIDRKSRNKKCFELDPYAKGKIEVPQWILIARAYVKTIIDGADKELLAAHPEGPFESVGEFQAFVDDCFHHLYDDYFRVHMLTWKFEIFEDWECTKPIPLTDADRYTEFIQLVLHGNPPLADRLDDAVTDYLERAGRSGSAEIRQWEAELLDAPSPKVFGSPAPAAASTLPTDEASANSADQADPPPDFSSELGRKVAIATYKKFWTTEESPCSEAALARTALVDPADLSKWKKSSLPADSVKKARIEKAIKNNEKPTPVSSRPADL